MHPLLPVAEKGFQRHKIRLRKRPLFAAGVVDLQMMEVKGHRQLAPVERRILLTVLQRGGGHLAHRHQVARRKDIPAHLLEIFVDARPVSVETATVADGVVREILIF